MQTNKVNIPSAFKQIDQFWDPHIIGELNGQHVKIAKIKGKFDWHAHAEADELFYVIAGAFTLEFRDRSIELQTGEMFIVPRGVEHRPVAESECKIMLFEPTGTLNTGDVVTDKTKIVLKSIGRG